MAAKKMLKRDCVGRLATTTMEIQSKGGSVIPCGAVVLIEGTYRGRFSVARDGVHITQVDARHLALHATPQPTEAQR